MGATKFSTSYNKLRNIESANRAFVDRTILSNLYSLFSKYKEFGVCLVHRHCDLEDDEVMVANGNITQPERIYYDSFPDLVDGQVTVALRDHNGRRSIAYASSWQITGEPFEFTLDKTPSLPLLLLEEFQGIVRLAGNNAEDVLGICFVGEAGTGELFNECTEGRRNILRKLSLGEGMPSGSIPTAFVLNDFVVNLNAPVATPTITTIALMPLLSCGPGPGHPESDTVISHNPQSTTQSNPQTTSTDIVTTGVSIDEPTELAEGQPLITHLVNTATTVTTTTGVIPEETVVPENPAPFVVTATIKIPKTASIPARTDVITTKITVGVVQSPESDSNLMTVTTTTTTTTQLASTASVQFPPNGLPTMAGPTLGTNIATTVTTTRLLKGETTFNPPDPPPFSFSFTVQTQTGGVSEKVQTKVTVTTVVDSQSNPNYTIWTTTTTTTSTLTSGE